MLWTITDRLMPTFGAVPLWLLGLWQRMQYSVLLRFSPCIERRVWHPLHLAISTTCRRLTIGLPSVEKYITLLSAPYCVDSCFTVPGRMVSARRASTPMAKVPLASAGTACV